MKTLSLIQGTPEWHAHRATHFNASDAPAMMGCSAYKTRTELLHEMHTGLSPDVDSATQARFDEGHRIEALARPVAEQIIREVSSMFDLYPVTGSDGKLSASFDGLTMDGRIVFEHKTLNAVLRATFDEIDTMAPEYRPLKGATELPAMYRIQMEQQLMVSGAERVLFVASNWNGDELVEERHTWYYSDQDLRSEILQGWTQFAIDLEIYVPVETVATPVGRTPETLPALHIEVTGMVTASNLAQYKEHALAVFASVSRDLKTDQDFADARKAIKWAGDIETRLQAAKQHALSQTESIDVLFKTIDDITEEARNVRLELNNLIKNRDVSLRADIVAEGRNALADHIAQCNHRIGRPLMPSIMADFANAIKGKSKFKNMRDAVANELARAKIAANEVADRITLNLRTLNEKPELAFLFADVAQLVLKAPDDLAAVVQNRISAHQAKEADRLEAQRLQIEANERAKAQAAERARADAEIAAATAKARAEALAQASADAQQAKRVSDDAITKAAIQPAPVTLRQVVEPLFRVEPMPVLGEKVDVDRNAAAFIDQIEAKQSAEPPSLKLGVICTRLGFQVTADFLKSLGFEPAGRERAAVLFHEADFPRICAVLVRHIQQVAQGIDA